MASGSGSGVPSTATAPSRIGIEETVTGAPLLQVAPEDTSPRAVFIRQHSLQVGQSAYQPHQELLAMLKSMAQAGDLASGLEALRAKSIDELHLASNSITSARMERLEAEARERRLALVDLPISWDVLAHGDHRVAPALAAHLGVEVAQKRQQCSLWHSCLCSRCCPWKPSTSPRCK